jgi:NADPH:quinone reductase-like Zn-dependent oxidoreductase
MARMHSWSRCLHVVLPIPDSLSFEEAAAAPMVFLTAWSMMVSKGNIRLAKMFWFWEQAPASEPRRYRLQKWPAVASLQRQAATRTRAGPKTRGGYPDQLQTDEFDKKIRDLTNKRGVDVVVDYIGADTWVRSLRSTRAAGAYLRVGPQRFCSHTDLRQIFFRQLQVIGSTMGSDREFRDVMQCVFEDN